MLHLIWGPMFAGKTTRLHEIASEAERLGQKTLIVKHAMDTRYSATKNITHTGDSKSCLRINSLSEIPQDILSTLDVLLIDEGQFFHNLPREVQECQNVVPSIVISGLDMDYKQSPFVNMHRISQLATVVELLKATCNKCCLRNASLTKRHVTNINRLLVGDASMYSPRCTHCFAL